MNKLFAVVLLAGAAAAQHNESWSRPFPAHRIAGNLYYVGTEDLACFLLTTPEGHILINTGLADSTPLLRRSFEQLGFRLEDVRILLTMQAHFDHVGAMAEVQRISGAKMYATPGDAPSLADGGRSDPAFGSGSWFEPVKVHKRLSDGEVIRLGGSELEVIPTPGHSKGSVSYAITVSEGGRKLSVAIVNMGTVVMPLLRNPKYPNIAEDFARSFERQKSLSPEIWVAAHASQYGMQDKRRAGSFVDPDGYKRAIEEHEKRFQEQLTKARAGRGR